MDITLLFTLFLIQDFNKPEPKKYDCHVQHDSDTFPGKTGSVSIILKEKATIRQQQTRNQTLAALQCSGTEGLVQVDVIISEKVYPGKSKIRYLLQNLKLITDQDEKDCATKCCLVSGEPERKFQNRTEVSLTGKVLLPGLSACVINSNQSEIFPGREQSTNKTIDKPPCVSDQTEERKKKSVIIKILIVCALLPVVLAIVIFVICEIPCPCSCPTWMLQRSMSTRLAARKKEKESMNLEASGTSTTTKI